MARRLAVLAPCRDQCPVLGEFHDAIVGADAVAVADIDVAVGRDDDGAGAAQLARRVAWHSGLADRHQHLTARAELDQIGALAILRELIPAHTLPLRST